MPHVRIRNVPLETVREASKALVDRLQAAIGCDRSWITLAVEPAIAVADGELGGGSPYVEVHWFPRPPEVKAAVSSILSDALKGGAEYLTTVFVPLAPADYYEDGKALG